MVLMIAAVLLAAAISGVAFLLIGRRYGVRRISELELRLASFEDELARKYRDRLASVRRRLGVFYLDGLPSVRDQVIAELFEGGVRHASQAGWERAFGAWSKAAEKADDAGVAALWLLCAGCHLLAGKKKEGRADIETALAAAQKSGDKAALASCRLALANLDSEESRHADAENGLKEVVRLSRTLHNPELESSSLVRLAEVSRSAGKPALALDYHRQALKAFEAAGDKVRASAEYGVIGEILLGLGDADKAKAAQEDGLLLARQAKDRLSEADRQMSIGAIYRVQRDGQRALDALERALRVYDELHHVAGQARTLYELGLVHERTGRADMAQECFEHSLSLARKTNDTALGARNLRRIADACLAHGASARALEMMEDAARLDRAAGRERELGEDLAGMGRVHLQLGEFDVALKHLTQALDLTRRTGDAKGEAWQLVEFARALIGSGRTQDALANLKQAAVLSDRLDEDRLAAAVRSETGFVYGALGDWTGAAAEHEAALGLHRKLGDLRGAAEDSIDFGVALEQQGELDDSRQRIEDGLRLAYEAGDRPAQARALTVLGSVNRKRGDLALARENLVRALQLNNAVESVSGEADSLVGLGQVHLDAGETADARLRLEQALRLYLRLDDRRRIEEVNGLLKRLPRSSQGVQFLDH